jgi:hypothetical protein
LNIAFESLTAKKDSTINTQDSIFKSNTQGCNLLEFPRHPEPGLIAGQRCGQNTIQRAWISSPIHLNLIAQTYHPCA